jgi:hypothetical protein
MTYDGKVFDLADDILFDYPHINTAKKCEDLAGGLQMFIDEWIRDELENYDGPPDPVTAPLPFCGND